jgi:hypothetical protein
MTGDHNFCDVCDTPINVDTHRCADCDWLLEEHDFDPVRLARLAHANANEARRLRDELYRIRRGAA